MNPSIPASQLVNVIPGVLSAGGNALSLNAVFLTQDTSIPIGTVQAFATLEDVQDWFGPTSDEAVLAAVYFGGFLNSTSLPSVLYFAQYNPGAVAGYLRGGSLSGMTLAQLQALSGSLTIAVDGETVISAPINLAGATSFSNAAALIQAGLQTAGGIFDGTGTIDDGTPPGAGTVLTITAVASGALHVGDVISGNTITAGTTVLAQVSGTPGGVGVYTVDTAQEVASGAVQVTSAATVTYDSLRAAFKVTSPTTGVDSSVGFATNTLAAGLKLTSATGAVQSDGAAAATAAGVLAGVVAVNQNWATFMTVWEPDLDDKLAFAAWVQTTNQRYAYIAWDSDEAPTVGDAPDSFGAQVKAAEDNGVFVLFDSDGKKAAFVCGVTASIDFTQTDGRITYAFKAQAGLTADVTDATVANNLLANGYNFYGAYATANQQFTNLQNGAIAGAWRWLDPYINQIWLNAALQLAYMVFFSNARSVPYNAQGYSMLRTVALDPIRAALNAGVIRAGITLSSAQRAQLNTAAGLDIASTVEQQGWFLLIQDATPEVRAARGSPPMIFWYTDGGSIQKIELASINVQ
jgi:hypothetical protein